MLELQVLRIKVVQLVSAVSVSCSNRIIHFFLTIVNVMERFEDWRLTNFGLNFNLLKSTRFLSWNGFLFSLLSFILRPLFGNPPFFEQIGINPNIGSNQVTFANQILSNSSNENVSTEAGTNNDGNLKNNFQPDRRKTRRRENRQRFFNKSGISQVFSLKDKQSE